MFFNIPHQNYYIINMKTLSKIFEEKVQPNGFCILKPGFTDHDEEFQKLLGLEGWKILDTTTRKLTRDEAARLYATHKDEPFYNTLCDYMITDDIKCYKCFKDCKDPIKEMDDFKQKIRKAWGKDDMKNAMHSSDSLDAVINECGICFGK